MTDSFDDAMTMLRKWYYDEIRAIAKDYTDRALKGEFDDRETFHEDLEQMLDDHEYVIYTAKAQAVCLASNHDDEYEDRFGEKPPKVEAQAMYAMLADVREYLDWTVIEEAIGGTLTNGGTDHDDESEES